MLKTQEGIIALQISDIIYMETENKAVVIHTANRNIVTYKNYMNLRKDWEIGYFIVAIRGI